MLAMRLVKLIEAHSQALCRDLTVEIRRSERTSDFRKIPAEDLRLAAGEVYRNIWEIGSCRRPTTISSNGSRPWRRNGWPKGFAFISSSGRCCSPETISGSSSVISLLATMWSLCLANWNCNAS